MHSNKQNLMREDLKIMCCWLSANFTLLAGVVVGLTGVAVSQISVLGVSGSNASEK